ncbi:ACP S-malonyltransferase [Agarilytica rhodophyticola]|uniref:ACP S-malonyltransferase n=1 Tax=Agarilytica rhodophyticola TaxID=1737490 RepID=UPI000B347232|nr:ACP S-malonyltransferase [Agarilytica rhodophyticola]
MMSVYIFPGQGAQYVGMGKDLFEQFPDLLAQADHCLGYSIKTLCLEDPDRVLSQTQFTQPAIYTVSALSFLARQAQGHRPPAYMAGHSLGEYSALFAAGAFDFITGLSIVKKRGELMSQAPRGAMAAVLQMDVDTVNDILVNSGFNNIDIANINSKQQSIISGLHEEIYSPELEQLITAKQGRFMPLNVSAAFHSRCMLDVEKVFSDFLSEFHLKPISIPVISNYTAKPYSENNYHHLLSRQISQPVRWYESISWLISQGFEDFVELGPGQVLTKIGQHIRSQPMIVSEPQQQVTTYKQNSLSDAASSVIGSNVNSITHSPGQPLQTVFMYAGQGSQYYHMGLELYQTNFCFKQSMNKLNAKVLSLSGRDILATLYKETARGEFENITYTHPALFMIGYSLTELMIDQGIKPDAVLGHSLGELIAAAVSGMIDVDDALGLIIHQSECLSRHGQEAGLLSIITSPDIYYRRPDLFQSVSLAGTNFDNNFIVAGLKEDLLELKSKLSNEGLMTNTLPVSYGFHSHHIDSIEAVYRQALTKIRVSQPRLPLYSSSLARQLMPSDITAAENYFWNIVRKPMQFYALIDHAFGQQDNMFFLDMSATGTLSTFLKYQRNHEHHHGFVINRYGHNQQTLSTLLNQHRLLATTTEDIVVTSQALSV